MGSAVVDVVEAVVKGKARGVVEKIVFGGW